MNAGPGGGARARIAVLGTGALGSLLAARLARGTAPTPTPGGADSGAETDSGAGADVTIAGTWRAALEAIREQGILVEADGAPWTVGLRAVQREQLGSGADADFDLVVVLVKSWQSAAVAPAAARAAGDRGLVLTLQNGLGNDDALTAHVERRRLALGVTTLGATLLAPGRVRWGGAGATRIALPPGDGTDRPRVRRALRAFAAAGLALRLVDDAEPARWGKLAVSCAINPLTALAGAPNGWLLETPARRALVAAIAAEVARLATARGIRLEQDPAEHALAVARATATNRSSMLQDVLSGRQTEIDALCGAVVKAAERCSVAMPLNRLLAACIGQRTAAVPSSGADCGALRALEALAGLASARSGAVRGSAA